MDTVTYTTYENIGSSKSIAANMSVNHTFTKALYFTLNGRLSYVWLKGDIDSQLYTNTGLQGYISLYIGYKINGTWSSGLTQTFSSSNVLLQGKTNSYTSDFLNISKAVFNKTTTIAFNASNPLMKYRNATTYTHDPDFYQVISSQNPYRSFVVSFNYRFGKLKKPIKKNQHGISNDDIKGNN